MRAFSIDPKTEDQVAVLEDLAPGTTSARKTKGKEKHISLPFLTYSAVGALRQGPGGAAESTAEAGNLGSVRERKGGREMRMVLLTTSLPESELME